MLKFLKEPLKQPNATLLDHHLSTTSALSNTFVSSVAGGASGKVSPLRNAKILEHLSNKLDESIDNSVPKLLNVKLGHAKSKNIKLAKQTGKLPKWASTASLIIDAKRSKSGLIIGADLANDKHFSLMSPTFSKKTSSRLEDEYLTLTQDKSKTTELSSTSEVPTRLTASGLLPMISRDDYSDADKK